jgi:ketosteroid isomerase-like protein
MNRKRSGSWMSFAGVTLACAVACTAPKTAAMTDAEARAVRDTVTVLENATNMAVDRLDCAAAFTFVGNREPMFVTNTTVIRKRDTFRKACDGMVANRTGAVYATDTLTAQALSRDAAYVVREGMYTVSMKDGTSQRQVLVMTTIWDRTSGEWKMVHLHESYRPIVP